uniref:LIM zinc-binding domain-containing protein n=1 Tax=Neogobius melanostomus TaxID=47308 RepID=A0A8C6WIY9_9GOBI
MEWQIAPDVKTCYHRKMIFMFNNVHFDVFIQTPIPKSEFCTVCRRRYHKSCFRCEHCRNRLSVGNYVSLHGHFYCLHHYKQLLNYNNGLALQSSEGGGGPSNEWRYSTGSLNSVDNCIF